MKKDYTTYDVEALAQDPAFIAWVKRGEGAAAWADWLAEHPEAEGKVAEAKQLVEAVSFQEESPSAEQTERMWGNIEAGTRESEDVQARVVPLWQRPRAWMGAAAAVAVLIVAGWWFLQSGGAEQISTAVAEQRVVELPDGSTVTLNAVSAVSFDRESWQQARTIELAGEAFFEVTKGARFTVVTDYGQVEVLGTSFNVNARPESFAVHCFTGKVRVSKGAAQTELLPGEGARAAGEQLVEEKFEGEENAAWRTGLHTFEAVPLRAVFAELERQYGYQVDFPEQMGERVYTGFFESGDLEEALKAVCWPMELEYELKAGQERVIVTQ
jgi:ferric-dicitrate binding protein FerR (iron transport regulator)